MQILPLLLFLSQILMISANYENAIQKETLQLAADSKTTNFREFSVNVKNEEFKITGFSHPVLKWKVPAETAASYLWNLSFTHIISLEKKSISDFSKHFIAAGGRHVVIDVDDYTAPTIDQLYSVFEFISTRKGSGKVGVHCMGGSGRTGTILAMLKMISLAQSNPEILNSKDTMSIHFQNHIKYKPVLVPALVGIAITAIREKDTYSRLAVETDTQTTVLVEFYRLEMEKKEQFLGLFKRIDNAEQSEEL